jgi:hypothetical protein
VDGGEGTGTAEGAATGAAATAVADAECGVTAAAAVLPSATAAGVALPTTAAPHRQRVAARRAGDVACADVVDSGVDGTVPPVFCSNLDGSVSDEVAASVVKMCTGRARFALYYNLLCSSSVRRRYECSDAASV